MNRTVLAASTFALLLHATVSFAATPADGIKAALGTAREKLLAMLDATDAPTMDKLQAEISKASKTVDTTLSSALADKGAPVDKYKELKAVWVEFAKTRDTEIIPKLRAGKKDEAKAIAKGVQAERYAKMQALLTALGAK